MKYVVLADIKSKILGTYIVFVAYLTSYY